MASIYTQQQQQSIPLHMYTQTDPMSPQQPLPLHRQITDNISNFDGMMSYPHNNNQEQQNHNMTTVSPLGATTVDPRKLWWRQSVVRRSVHSIQSDFEQVVCRSPFLQLATYQLPQKQHIGLFHRSEICTGKLLGKGGFSEVYEITGFLLNDSVSRRLSWTQQQVRLHYVKSAVVNGVCRYAIKQLQETLIDKPNLFKCAAADLAVEAAYMSALDHNNILRINALPIDGIQALREGHHDGYFLVTERLHGTLDSKIEEWNSCGSSGDYCSVADAPCLEDRISLALQLADALQYLHDRHIIFRDLKPANIGLTEDGRVQLFDFGLSRQLPLTSSSTMDDVYEMSGVGTRRYMATEIINDGRYNCKADVYSWSMVFWEMLSLVKPYDHYSMEEHGSRVCEGGERPYLPANWPQSIQNLLRYSWIESLKKRFTMNDVCYMLRTIAEVHRGCVTSIGLPRVVCTGGDHHDEHPVPLSTLEQLSLMQMSCSLSDDSDLYSRSFDDDDNLLVGPILEDDSSFSDVFNIPPPPPQPQTTKSPGPTASRGAHAKTLVVGR